MAVFGSMVQRPRAGPPATVSTGGGMKRQRRTSAAMAATAGVLCIAAALCVAAQVLVPSTAWLTSAAARQMSVPVAGVSHSTSKRHPHSGGPRSSLALEAKGFDPMAEAEPATEDAGPVLPIHGELQIKALGGGPGSFLLNMGGMRILVNPVLDGVPEPAMEPEQVHEQVDYVIITSPHEDYMHMPTLLRMNLMKVNFVADAKSGEALERLLVRNLAVLGPMGRALLSSDTDSAPVGVLIAPGADGPLPWSPPESAFLFVNMKSGICVAYEATGQFLGKDAATGRSGIPDEAYQADYLITPSLVSAQGTCRGLSEKGAQLRGVVHLPEAASKTSQAGNSGGLIGFIENMDDRLDTVLRGSLAPKIKGETAEEFNEFLRSQGAPLSNVRLFEPAAGGEFVKMEA